MALIIKNNKISDNIFLMTISGCKQYGKPGQFFMLRPIKGNISDPILARPISIFDVDKEKGNVTFLYQVVGKGTEILSSLKVDDEISVIGPLGNGFEIEDNDITLIGGGIGIAPLFYLAKEHRKMFPNRHRTIHLGFRDKAILEDEYKSICDNLVLNIGGYVTDDVDFDTNNTIYVCGPTPMMKAASTHAKKVNKDIYVSLENKMACGVGACLVCSCKTSDGTKKRVCKDGPVFHASEVFYE